MKTLASILLCILAAAAPAAVTMAPLFNDHLVLQRDLPVPVWGRAAPGERIVVRFGAQAKEAVAGPDGRWSLRLDPLPASKIPAELTVQGRNTITLHDVVVGDVWICSGQSNMCIPVCQSLNSAEELAAARHPLIRLARIETEWARSPQDTCARGGAWSVCTPESVAWFSGVGYFFGRELQRELDVPIGLLQIAWGGTPIEPYIPLQALQADPAFAAQVEAFRTRLDDPGNDGERAGWAKPEADPAGWTDTTTDGYHDWDRYCADGVSNVFGAVWFRTEIDLPAAWAGSALTFAPGPIAGADTVYVNGVAIGSTGRATPGFLVLPRSYPVPAKLVRPGRNTVAIRVFKECYNVGIIGSAKDLRLIKAGEAPLPLGAAGWKVRSENHSKGLEMHQVPTTLFNAMVSPAIPYAMKGVIWYQGESNAAQALAYRRLLPALIRGWRTAWGEGDFPFHLVQLPNYMARKAEPSDSAWAELREAQAMALATPNTGMAVTIDLGEAEAIHPANKQAVGHRLALVALAKTYGRKIEASGPVFSAMRIDGDHATLSFTHLGGGLVAKGAETLSGFAVCGPDGRFAWAEARIDGETVVVRNPAVRQPVAVRYAWADNPACNLYNQAGLPAAPFRTDHGGAGP